MIVKSVGYRIFILFVLFHAILSAPGDTTQKGNRAMRKPGNIANCPGINLAKTNVITTAIRENGTMNFRCSGSGFQMLGKNVSVCIRKQWSPSPPVCVAVGQKIKCPRIDQSIREPLIVTEFPGYNKSVLDFSCLPGFKLEGHSRIYCSKGKKWSDPIPNCIDDPELRPAEETTESSSLSVSTLEYSNSIPESDSPLRGTSESDQSVPTEGVSFVTSETMNEEVRTSTSREQAFSERDQFSVITDEPSSVEKLETTEKPSFITEEHRKSDTTKLDDSTTEVQSSSLKTMKSEVEVYESELITEPPPLPLETIPVVETTSTSSSVSPIHFQTQSPVKATEREQTSSKSDYATTEESEDAVVSTEQRAAFSSVSEEDMQEIAVTNIDDQDRRVEKHTPTHLLDQKTTFVLHDVYAPDSTQFNEDEASDLLEIIQQPESSTKIYLTKNLEEGPEDSDRLIRDDNTTMTAVSATLITIVIIASLILVSLIGYLGRNFILEHLPRRRKPVEELPQAVPYNETDGSSSSVTLIAITPQNESDNCITPV